MCNSANRQKQAEHIKCGLSSSGSAACVAVRWSMIGTTGGGGVTVRMPVYSDWGVTVS